MTAATAGVNDQVASPSSEPLRQPSPDAALQTESRTVAPLASDKYHPRDRQHQGSGLGWTVEPRHAGKVSKANTAPVLDARSLLGDPGVTRTASNGGSCSHDSHHDHHHHHHHHHHVPHTSVPIAPLGPAGDAVPGGRETDQLELLKYSSVELNNIPQDYLNSYPYPAFVLISGVPPTGEDSDPAFPLDLPWTRTKFANLRPFEPVWANQRWKQLARGRSLLDCLSMDNMRRLGDWLTGAQDPAVRKRLAKASGWRKAEWAAGGREVDIVNDDAANSWDELDGDRSTYDPLGSLESSRRQEAVQASVTLEFSFIRTSVHLQLSKTTMPIYQNHGSQRSLMSTHTFVVVTSTPVPETNQDLLLAEPPISDWSRSTSSSRGRGSSQAPPYAVEVSRAPLLLKNARCTSPEEMLRGPQTQKASHMDAGELLESIGEFEPGRPLYFFRDGSVVHTPPTTSAAVGDKPWDVADLMERTNWTTSPLGPREQWSISLQALVELVLSHPLPASIWWGNELTLIYNQRYADKVSSHPQSFAQSGSKSWAEFWTSLGPLSEVVLNGTPIYREDEFVLAKACYTPRTFESYRTQVWVPLKNEEERFTGVFHCINETTSKVLADRRGALIRELGERASLGRSLEDFDRALLATIEEHPKDVPFALIFHVEANGVNSEPRKFGSRAGSLVRGASPPNVRLRYAGGVGVPDGHPSAPATCSFELPAGEHATNDMMATAFTAPDVAPSIATSKLQMCHTPMRNCSSNTAGSEESAFIVDCEGPEAEPAERWPFLDLLLAHKPVVVRNCSNLIKGYPIRVWDELPTSAILLPVVSNAEGSWPVAIIVLGLSCRLPFDAEYQAFLRAMRLQLASHLAAARSYEDDLKRMEELADLDRAKSLLFSNVSHELVTPLSLISGPLDDVLAELPPGRQREALIMARRNAERLSRLVGMLMDISSLEAGSMASSFRRVNLGEVTRNVAAMFRHASDDAHLTYVVNCDMENNDVFIDRDKYEKIMFTLIGNSLRFTQSGTIHVSVHYEGATAVITVQDTGVGIPAKDLVFGEKYPDDDAFNHGHEGSGISLSFTKKLVQLHHGTFKIESCTAEESSDGSHGTKFIVTLPLGCQHLPPDAIEAVASPDSTPLQRFHQSVLDDIPNGHWGWAVSSSMQDGGPVPELVADRKSRGIDPSTLYFEHEDVVLLVDSLLDTRRYMRSIFEPFCKVVEARDGHEALEKVAECNPDLIIADIMLPKMNGFALLNALKTGTREQQMVPIILLTAMHDARADGAFGADDYMPKPFNARELIARAHMQLQLGKKRRALETAFEERTNELRLLTEYSPVGIFRCTEDGYVTYANAAWYELAGYPPGEPVTNWGDYVGEEHQVRVGKIWEQYVAQAAIHESCEWQWKNGRWVSTTVIRVDRPGAKSNIIGCSVDITERKINERMQREQIIGAEQRRAAAEEARRQQELLIDITSHEIRNPISSLMQCASLVKSNLLALQEQMQCALEEGSSIKPTAQLIVTMGEDLEALDSIYQCGLTQERISNDVLSLGKIQLDMLQMFDVETDIRKEAQKLIFVFQNEARMKRLNLSLVMSDAFEELGVEKIMTDPVRLGQIVTNLLSNAIRFTANSAVRTVELRLDIGPNPPSDGTSVKPISSPSSPSPSPSPSPSTSEASSALTDDTPLYLFVSVADTGPGLTPAELETLFQRFSQASPETHTVYGGSGLGLFVCRQLTERMGGRIDVASEYGKGSEFRFYIRTHACPAPRHEAKARPKPAGKAPIAGPFKPHILVVEDNLINRTVLMRQLQHIGLTVESASNGLEALERLRQVQGVNGPVSNTPDPRPNRDGSALGGVEKAGSDSDVPSIQPEPRRRRPQHLRSVSALQEGTPKPSPAYQGPQKRFDCVLMDLEMPVMDGYTSVRLLREDEEAGKLLRSNVVALTGNARQAQISEAMADFTDVVVKPYRLDDLLSTIDSSIRKHLDVAIHDHRGIDTPLSSSTSSSNLSPPTLLVPPASLSEAPELSPSLGSRK